MIMKAIKRMLKAAAEPEVRAVMEYREKAELDYLNGIANARLLGKEEGVLLGSKKALESVAVEMLGNGIDVETVMQFTKLSRNDILKLLEETTEN